MIPFPDRAARPFVKVNLRVRMIKDLPRAESLRTKVCDAETVRDELDSAPGGKLSIAHGFTRRQRVIFIELLVSLV